MGKLRRGKKSIGRQRKKREPCATKQPVPDVDGPNHAQSKFNQALDDHNYTRTEPVNVCGFSGNITDCNCIYHKVDLNCDQQYNVNSDSDAFTDDADAFYLIIGNNVQQYDPHENIDEIILSQLSSTFQRLKVSILEHEQELIEQNFNILKSTEKLHLMQFYEHDNIVSIKLCITVDCNLRPTISVHGKPVSSSHSVYQNVASVFSVVDLIKLVKSVSGFCVCIGNPDPEFVAQFVQKSKGKAYLENNLCEPTIRSSSCSLLTLSNRCKSCCIYRCTLRSKVRDVARTQECGGTLQHSSKPNCAMSREELEEKTRSLKCKTKNLQLQNKRLKNRLELEIRKSDQLSTEDTAEVQSLVHEASSDVEKLWPDPHSFQRIFWDEQLRYNKLKSKSAMRWHPLIIKWALLIKSQSSKAYQTMRELGFIQLPSERTLYDYSHCIPSKLGFVPEAIEMLIKECQNKGLYNEKWKGYVGLLQDEIKIKDNLVYCPTTGQLIGFVDLDETSNQILELQNSIFDKDRKLANSVLVVMVRGATSDLKFPLAAFATNGLDSTQLYTNLWRAIEILEIDVGLKVLFITCDGAGQNRKFFDMHKSGNSQGPCNSVPNPYAEDDRQIYFISDVPHLLKTTRNCFANSGSHHMTRKMWKDGKNVLWMHIVRLYEDNIENHLYTKSVKLTRAHIDLTSFSQMKVDLAAQVLSNRVAHQLEAEYGEEVSETVKFIRHMNKFFDCLNTRNLYEARNKCNPNIKPYDDVDDPRLDYLLTDFLGFFDDWKTSVESRPGKFTSKELASMQLSQATLDGLKITVHSIVDCVRLLLKEGAPFVMTAVFNQDVLEQHFGHYRHKGGACDTPTVNDIRHTMNSLRVVGSSALAPLRGNTKRQNCTPEYIDSPLPRKRSRSSEL